ncbi:MAG: hypothetical protein AB7S72_08855 [Draconibacterium sp.]
MTLKTKISIIVLLFFICACSDRQKPTEESLKGEYLELDYKIHSKRNLFPNDNIELYSGFIVFKMTDKQILGTDLAETIRQIGIKENLISAKIFSSQTGYMMEVDSIPRKLSDYYESFTGYYDLINKGPNWKYLFRIDDIHFKGDLTLKIDVK